MTSCWVQTECARCGDTFRYWYFGNRGRLRMYCRPKCKADEQRDTNAFTAFWVSRERAEARNAHR